MLSSWDAVPFFSPGFFSGIIMRHFLPPPLFVLLSQPVAMSRILPLFLFFFRFLYKQPLQNVEGRSNSPLFRFPQSLWGRRASMVLQGPFFFFFSFPPPRSRSNHHLVPFGVPPSFRRFHSNASAFSFSLFPRTRLNEASPSPFFFEFNFACWLR